jgi:hypothetical protein
MFVIQYLSLDSSVSIVIVFGLDDHCSGRGFFPLYFTSRPGLRPAEPLKCLRGALYQLKRPGHKAGHSPTYNVEFKNGRGAVTSFFLSSHGLMVLS